MAKRGRTSIAAITAPRAASVEMVERVKPPHDLNDEETEVWVAVTEAEAADWFTPATVPLLAQYCRHVVRARHVAHMIERYSGDGATTLDDYNKLLLMQARESMAICTLATKMRLSQQSTTNHRGNKKPTTVKVWEG